MGGRANDQQSALQHAAGVESEEGIVREKKSVLFQSTRLLRLYIYLTVCPVSLCMWVYFRKRHYGTNYTYFNHIIYKHFVAYVYVNQF